jgi:hypothetical protein
VGKATLRIGSPVTSTDLSIDCELLLDVTADSPWQQPVKNSALRTTTEAWTTKPGSVGFQID